MIFQNPLIRKCKYTGTVVNDKNRWPVLCAEISYTLQKIE